MAIANAYQWKSSFRQMLFTTLAKLQKDHLWQRMLKITICTTITLIIGLIPAIIAVFGKSTYLGAMLSVFGHPGRRFGQMTEILMLILLGTFVGMGWSIFGLYLSSLVYESNATAAYAIRAVFFTLALILHGILRSSTPRLFMFVFFLLLISLTILTTTAKQVTSTIVSTIAYPILTAVGVVIVINVTIFPEPSSGFLGNSIIETLCDTVRGLEDAGDWFMSDSRDANYTNTEKSPVSELRMKLVSLTDRKPKLRAKLASSKKAQAECNFEIVYTVLPPRSLKSISTGCMTRLVQNTISVINSCESKYALAGLADEGEAKEADDDVGEKDDADDSDSSSSSSCDSSSDTDSDTSVKRRPKTIRRKSKHVRNLELVKPIREIESGDINLFEHILSQVRVPAKVLQDEIRKAVTLITTCLAYCYDVPKLPSGARTPHGITLEEIDIRVDAFVNAMALFDVDSAHALEQAAAMAYGDDSQVDIMPRMETFLISSFLITLRQAASQISEILKYSRLLVQKRQDRHGRKNFFFPKISWKKWLKSGGEQDENALPEDARKEARKGRGTREDHSRDDEDEPFISSERPEDEEIGQKPQVPAEEKVPRRKGPHKSDGNTSLWLRGLAADAVEFLADSDDLAFALKMSIAGWLVTWPAFVPAFNAWYNTMRGSWASLQLILVFEVSVGTSFQGFILRAFGVVFGCTVGFLAYEIGQGNRIVAVVILAIGIIPSTYVQLATPYVKTGIISIVSMSVVGLATILQPDTEIWLIYVKRLVCFLLGGTVALLVEMTLFPVRARDILVESLASGIQQISNMEASVAIGIDRPEAIDVKSHALNESFTRAKEKAEAALGAARTVLPFTLVEPRLKGSFKGQAMIYNEIVYVLFQIIDRMDNMLHIRKAYGSSVLEELNEQVLPYRRNVAASITLTLFAVYEALTTRLPLPQFLPSSRVAQLRYISRVREVMLERTDSAPGSSATSSIIPRSPHRASTLLQADLVKAITKQNFLSWNASSAGMMEIIEYLEELVDLAKLLVGVNAFRSGMLERPKFHEYVKKIKAREMASATVAETEQEVERIKSTSSANLRKQRGFLFRRSNSQSAAGIKRRQTFGAGDGAADSMENECAVADDLPLTLQRVRTRRMEDQEFERVRRASTADKKGKTALKKGKTWMV